MEEKELKEERGRLYRILRQDVDWIRIVREAIQVEKWKEEEYKEKGYGTFYGWEWFMVHASPHTLNKMVYERVLDVTLSTRSGTHFRVRNPSVVVDIIKDIERPTKNLFGTAELAKGIRLSDRMTIEELIEALDYCQSVVLWIRWRLRNGYIRMEPPMVDPTTTE